VKSAFFSENTDWISNCETIEQLTFSLLGLQHLNHPSSLFGGELKEAIHESSDELDAAIKGVLETIQELESKQIPGGYGITFAQMVAYRELYKTNAGYREYDESNQNCALHIPRDGNNPGHAVTLDPLNNRFFVHLKKKGEFKNAVLKSSNYTVHKAVMVVENQLILINETVYQRDLLMRHDIELRKIFSDCPYIINPPLAITHYPDKKSQTRQITCSSSEMYLEPHTSAEKTALLGDCFDINLSAMIAKKQAKEDHAQTIDILLDAAQGLDRLHTSHSLHGDINPDNIQIRYVDVNQSMKAQGLLGNLKHVREVGRDEKIKHLPERVNEEMRTHSDERHVFFRIPEYTGNEYYAPPECCEQLDEPKSLSGDIWAFGITLWQSIYGEHAKDFPFKFNDVSPILMQISELTQYYINKSLKKRMPLPRTYQEAAIQNLIQRCLKRNPQLRIKSAELVKELQKIKQLPTTPYPLATASEQNICDLFQPFAEFEKNIGSHSKKSVGHSLRRATSHIKLPRHSTGTRSLPPELFNIFSKQGKLRKHLEEAGKLIRKSYLVKPHPIEEIEKTWISLSNARHVIGKLEKLMDKFQQTNADLLVEHREELGNTSSRLEQLEKWINHSIVLNSGGLTYGQIKYYRQLLKAKLKVHKTTLGTMGEEGYERPIAYHFPKGSEKGLTHAISLEPGTKSLFIHLKKTGLIHKELGKGAVKSVHSCVQLKNNTITECADVVIRFEAYDDQEEQLKLLFKDCPYIEDAANVVVLYEKNEIPNLWKSKKNLNQEEIEKIKQEQQSVTVRKLAFFSPLYQSFGKLSYHCGEERNISLIVQLLSDVSKGLLEMHSKNYIHRDLKPGNILIKTMANHGNRNLIGVLADMGEATLVAGDGMIPTGIPMAGTMHYNSPEICLDENDPNYRRQSFASDIWAFGVLMCQSLYGKHGRDIPFIDNDSQLHIFTQLASLTQETIDEALDQRFPSPLGNPLEERAQIMIKRCLRLNPDQRPDAWELSEMLSEGNL
jgi:serine/threonine protein kinase